MVEGVSRFQYVAPQSFAEWAFGAILIAFALRSFLSASLFLFLSCTHASMTWNYRISGTAKRARAAGQLRHRASGGFLAQNSPARP
jgi:hypothetical protein